MSYVGRVNYVVSLVSLTSLLDRRSEDLGEETTGLQPLRSPFLERFWNNHAIVVAKTYYVLNFLKCNTLR